MNKLLEACFLAHLRQSVMIGRNWVCGQCRQLLTQQVGQGQVCVLLASEETDEQQQVVHVSPLLIVLRLSYGLFLHLLVQKLNAEDRPGTF